MEEEVEEDVERKRRKRGSKVKTLVDVVGAVGRVDEEENDIRGNVVPTVRLLKYHNQPAYLRVM